MYDDLVLFENEPWAECEIEHLKSLYGRIPNVQIALDLKRSAGAIGTKAHALGLNTRTNAKCSEGSAVARRAWSIALRKYFEAACA